MQRGVCKSDRCFDLTLVASASFLGVPDTSDTTLNGLLADPEVNRAFGERYYRALLAKHSRLWPGPRNEGASNLSES